MNDAIRFRWIPLRRLSASQLTAAPVAMPRLRQINRPGGEHTTRTSTAHTRLQPGQHPRHQTARMLLAASSFGTVAQAASVATTLRYSAYRNRLLLPVIALLAQGENFFR
ncbi:MAG: hypothetical protein R3C44_09570 [Chloroflexota bacterium]